MKAAVIFLTLFSPSGLIGTMVTYISFSIKELTWPSSFRPAQVVTSYGLLFWTQLLLVLSGWHNTVQNCRKLTLVIAVSFKACNWKGQKHAKKWARITFLYHHVSADLTYLVQGNMHPFKRELHFFPILLLPRNSKLWSTSHRLVSNSLILHDPVLWGDIITMTFHITHKILIKHNTKQLLKRTVSGSASWYKVT